jgi:tRNA dimethylallyltransferase
VSVNPAAAPAPSALPRVPVLVGPTASGKTAVSLELAGHLDAEIISADSRQIYKYMDIGTAKPTEADRMAVRHYFVDELLPDQDFNAGEFGRLGREIVTDIINRGKTPLVVGGSGLYIRALVDGFFEGPAADPETRRSLYEQLHERGKDYLYEKLQDVDPVSASRMIPANTRRIIRALEVFRLTGVPISSHHQHSIEPGFRPVIAGLEWERAQLYERINRRVDDMMADGLVDEVRRLRDLGYDPGLNALQTVGYREVFQYLDGKRSLDETVALIKQNTRRFAKRQITWFRPDTRIVRYAVSEETDLDALCDAILQRFRNTS